MLLKRVISFLLVVFCAYPSFAQVQGEQMRGDLVQSRILILFDESSSMIQSWTGGKEKYMAAHDIILKLMDSVYSVNPMVEFGLRVFGHQSTVAENNCYDTKLEVLFSRDNRAQMALRLADIHPLGVTPIAYALTQAAEHDLVDEKHNVYSIILITDGGESCGGDICAVMKNLLKDKVYFKPYIVSLENDATLKTTYSCMGNFLQVTAQKDIPAAVGAIVEAFRPVIKITPSEYKELQANIPSVLKVNVPPPGAKWTMPMRRIVSSLTPGDLLPVIIAAPVAKKVKKIEMGFSLPPVVLDEPIAKVTTAHTTTIAIAPPQQRKLKEMDLALKMPAVVNDTPRREKIARLSPGHLKQLQLMYVIEDHNFQLMKVPPLPRIKVDAVAPTPSGPVEKKREYRVETEDAPETNVEIYFTNGAGTFYSTTPQVLLIDPETKRTVKKFFRTVDASGNPDPQTGIPVGVYDLSFASKSSFILRGVNIERNKKNKIFVTITHTALSFAYENAPDRPVSEFTAIVTERNKAHGRVQEQKCTDALMYEPGNYHIVINTFPQVVRNVDLDFDDESVITIPQPGFAKFTSDGKARAITLFQRLGDKFLAFHTLDLNDPRSQHLQMQPGEYQAHYQKGPGQANAAETVLLFVVRPTQETEVILK